MSYEWLERAPVRAYREIRQDTDRASSRAAAIERACESLFARQAPEGFWCGELTADATLESDYILLQLWLHQPEGDVWDPPTRARIAEGRARPFWNASCPMAASISTRGGPAELSATMKAYCALKLAGHSAGQRSAAARARAHSGRWAACRPPTATSRSTSACSASTRASTRPRCRRKSCCCPATCSTKCRRGRAPSWCRFPSCRRAARTGARRPASRWTNCCCPASAWSCPSATGLSVLFHHLDRVFKVWEKRGSQRIRDAAIRAGRALDSGPHPLHRGPGRHLSGDDVLHHGARCAGLSQGPSRPGGRRPPLRIAAHRNARTASYSSPACRPSGIPPSDALRAGRSGLRATMRA